METFDTKFFGVSWVVPDIDEAMDRWTSTTGVGPFYIRREMTAPNMLHFGASTDLVVSIAFAQANGTQIALIQQHNDVPSAYRDVFGPAEGGMHHIAGFTTEFDAALAWYEDRGFGQALYSDSGIRVAYFDTRSDIGCMTEIIESQSSLALQAEFKMIEDAAVDWDGTNPVRALA
jgi:hypothetical protein